MKKFLILSTALVLTFCLSACNMCAQPQTTVPTPTATAPTTTATQPTSVVTMPTIDSNIPDPTVEDNSNMQDMLPDNNGTGSDNGGMNDGGMNDGNNATEPGSSVPSQQSRTRRRGY